MMPVMSLVLLLIVGLGLIDPLPASAGPITIRNLVDTTFHSTPMSRARDTFLAHPGPGIHILVDIPGTPWVSN